MHADADKTGSQRYAFRIDFIRSFDNVSPVASNTVGHDLVSHRHYRPDRPRQDVPLMPARPTFLA